MTDSVESIVNAIGDDLSRRARLLRIKRAFNNEAGSGEWNVNDMLLGVLKNRTENTINSGPGVVMIRNDEGTVDWWTAGDMNVDEFLALLENVKMQVILHKLDQMLDGRD